MTDGTQLWQALVVEATIRVLRIQLRAHCVFLTVFMADVIQVVIICRCFVLSLNCAFRRDPSVSRHVQSTGRVRGYGQACTEASKKPSGTSRQRRGNCADDRNTVKKERDAAKDSGLPLPSSSSTTDDVAKFDRDAKRRRLAASRGHLAGSLGTLPVVCYTVGCQTRRGRRHRRSHLWQISAAAGP